MTALVRLSVTFTVKNFKYFNILFHLALKHNFFLAPTSTFPCSGGDLFTSL